MNSRTATHPVWIIGFALYAALSVDACGSGGGIVGGDCMSGYTACGHSCVNLMADPANCGACGNACQAGAVCVAGVCIGEDQLDGGGDGFFVETGTGGGAPDNDAADVTSATGGSSGGGAGGAGGDAGGGDGGTSGTGDGGSSVGGSSGVGGSGFGGSSGVGGSAGTDAGGAGGSGGEVTSDAGVDAGDGSPVDPDAEPVDAGSDASGPDSADSTADVEPDAIDAAADLEVDSCVPPYDNAQNCGACGVVCHDPTPVCKPDGNGGYACAPFCDDGLTKCGTQCVDLLNDGNNCGACGHVCPTGLCQAGQCRGSLVGNIVVMGMNFRTWTPDGPPVRAFANAAFLPAHNPVYIAAYGEYADSTVNQVEAVLAWGSTYKGRSFVLSPFATAVDVATELSIDHHDLLLVHDQPNAPAGELAKIGSIWQATLNSYVRAGGTVLVLATNRGVNEMPDLLTSAALLDTTAVTSASGSILVNRAPADVVGANVQSPFLARLDTVTFTTSQPASSLLSYVITQTVDAGDEPPVVLHRVVPP